MRVFNKNKTKELTDYDLSKGYLEEDTIINHYDEVKAVEEQGHYETIKEYANGGKDVAYIIDVEGVEGKEAYDEEERIRVYIPYTESELRTFEINNRIKELKQLLFDSDYRAIKYVEGEYTEEQYAPYKAQRHQYRVEINELESELESLCK